MPRHIEKCEHGVVVSGPEALTHKPGLGEIGYRIVPCPEDCGVRILAEETMWELPFENAEQDRLRRQDHAAARTRFQGHNPYRGM